MNVFLQPGLPMQRIITLSILVVVLCGMVAWPATAQQKLAQTGMKFLAVGTDARAVALGEAVTSVEGTSSSLFFNPAAMARISGFTSISVGQTKWIADIKHNFGSIAFSPFDGEYGVIGFMLQAVDYGEFEGTVRATNEKGYLDNSDIPGLNFKPSALMFGFGYARALSDKFSLGAGVKYVQQNLGDAINSLTDDGSVIYNPDGTPYKLSNKSKVLAFDFGILYHTGFKSLNFGMTVRNFSNEARFQNEGFQLPLTFRIGLSMNVLDLTDLDKEMHSFLVTFDAEHPRDFQEQLKIGGEYTFMKILSLRIGYVSPADEHGVVYGVGLQKMMDNLGLGIDYAYTPCGIFGNVHRFSFQFSY